MSGRSNPVQLNPSKGKAKEKSSESTHAWGTSGNTLAASSTSREPKGVRGARVPQPQRIPQKKIERSPSPDWGVDDDDDDAIMIDSD